MPGSGKSTAIKAVSDLGVVVTMGDVIREEAIRKKIELTDENLGKLAKNLRKEEGDEAIAEKCVDIIKNIQSEVIFVDGIRSPYELTIFRKHWKFPLILIDTKEEIRHIRILERMRDDDSKNIKDLKRRDDREIGFGLLDLIQKADYIVENNSTVKKLKKKTRALVKHLIKKYASL
jgi:dephospho-CoA kinase